MKNLTMNRPWAIYNKSGVLLKRKKTRRFALKLAADFEGATVVYEPNYQEAE